MLDRAKVKSLREKAGLTQAQAAERAGFYGRQQWNRFEAGKSGGITLDTLERIAKALGVKAKDLLK